MLKRRVVLKVLLVLGLILTPMKVISASDSASTHFSPPRFVDGYWVAVMSSSGPILITEQFAQVSIRGSGYISVLESQVSGEYRMFGENLVFGGDLSSTGSMTSVGQWTGEASSLGMVDGNTELVGITQVDGTVQEVTFNMPSTGAITYIPLISATCTMVVGDFTSVVNNSFFSAGATPLLTGSFVATRVLDIEPGEANSLADTYRESASQLMLEGITFSATAQAERRVDPAVLNELLTRAEAFYEVLERSAECDIANADAWMGLLAGMVLDLLQAALADQDVFDNLSLLRIVSSASRMGLLSDYSTNRDWGQLESDLLSQLILRGVETELENDCDGALALSIAAGILGAAGSISDSVVIACGG